MPINTSSGRIVVDLDPALKMRLHSALIADGLNLKRWVAMQARAYLAAREAAPLAAEPGEP